MGTCMDICPMVCDRLRTIPRKETTTPTLTTLIPVRVRLGSSSKIKMPPIMAITTYIMLPILPRAGISTLPKRLAFWEFSNSSRLYFRNSSLAACSWLKTWTTFWPSIISSMKPSSSASERCCLTMNLADLPPRSRVINIIRPAIKNTTRASHTE